MVKLGRIFQVSCNIELHLVIAIEALIAGQRFQNGSGRVVVIGALYVADASRDDHANGTSQTAPEAGSMSGRAESGVEVLDLATRPISEML